MAKEVEELVVSVVASNFFASALIDSSSIRIMGGLRSTISTERMCMPVRVWVRGYSVG